METTITIKVVAALLMLWSQGKDASAVRFDNVEECEAARNAILEKYRDSWNAMGDPNDVLCIPVKQSVEVKQ